MTILSMEAKIKELEAELEASKKELAHIKDNFIGDEAEGRWLPQEGELFYVICADGEVNAQHFNEDMDFNYWKIGNCFRTLKEADFIISKLRVIAKLKKFTESRDRYWGESSIHYYIAYDYMKDEILILDTMLIEQGGTLYFGTYDAALSAIREVGKEDLKTYYFNVRK